MAARLGVEVGAIEAARRSVIALTQNHLTTARVTRKQAVKDLFGTLMASWEAGVSFDAMAKALNASGLDMTTETLRGYFFELKAAEQLRTENQVHEQAMAKLRQGKAAKQHAQDLEHARDLFRVNNELESRDRAAKAEAARQVASEAMQTASRRTTGTAHALGHALKLGTVGKLDQDSPPQSSLSGLNAQSGGKNASTVVRVPVSTASSAMLRHLQGATAPRAAVRGKPTEEAIGKGNRADPDVEPPHTVQARTLSEVAKISQGQQESVFAENLVLKDGNTVWYESGKPFEGFLSPRTLHTLRTVGKAIAPTIGRTAKDFVLMNYEL